MKQTLKNAICLFYKGACLFTILIGSLHARGQQAQNSVDTGFSFAIYGDSRSMMYFPYKADQEQQVHKLLVDMFSLVFPAKVSEEVVNKHVRITYDPKSGELLQIVQPFASASEVMTLKIDKGWVTEASVEDTKLLPGVSRTMYRMAGGHWVTEQIVKEVKSGRASFVLNNGDLVWWGQSGKQTFREPLLEIISKTNP
ncbi:MAG TPA: hypothetical protein VMI35_10920 [Puia sp.]|nr:hypothetical protein [Puia sp.]